MNSKIRIIQRYGLWLIDTVCIILSFHLSYFIRYGRMRRMYGRSVPGQLLLIFIAFTIAYNFFFDWNHGYLQRKPAKEFRAVFLFNVWMLIAAVICISAAHQWYFVSRLLLGRFFLINLGITCAAHLLFKLFLRRVLRIDQLVTKVFVISQPEYLKDTIEHIRAASGLHTEIIGAAVPSAGYVGAGTPAGKGKDAGISSGEDAGAKGNSGTASDTLSGENGEVSGVPVIYGIEDITERLTTTPVDEVLIRTPDISQRRLRDVIAGFEEMGVTCHYSLELPGTGAGNIRLGEFGSYSVITYQKNLVSSKRLILKRVMDILGGIVGLAMTGILTVFIAPAVKIDSPGPLFFSQIRVGKNGRRFRIYKFRTMCADAEERKQELMDENEMNGPMFKMEHDPRVTRVGAFLRRTSLDEFPQFLNVLKGDMSLVGTRPPTEEEFEKYNEHYRRRISMTPGLTGLWQVSGRSDIKDFDEVVKLDLEYIDNWSLSLDLKILLKTVGILFTRKGAR